MGACVLKTFERWLHENILNLRSFIYLLKFGAGGSQVILSLYYVLMRALLSDIFQSLYYLKHFTPAIPH